MDRVIRFKKAHTINWEVNVLFGSLIPSKHKLHNIVINDRNSMQEQ
jgi:hypothetical protein